MSTDLGVPAIWLTAAALPIILLVACRRAGGLPVYLSLGATVAAQFRAAVRFSEQR